MIKLNKVFYDQRARDGTWCCHPYQGHPRGCPNFIKGCTASRPSFADIAMQYEWYAFVKGFNLKQHAEAMKAKHPYWSDRQCRNPLYWQGSVRAALREACILEEGDILLDIPEACGVDVFKTMAEVEIILERKPDRVIKVMLVGKKLV